MVEKAAVKRWIFTILSVYIFCQPLLDIITSFQRQVDQTLTVGTVIRSLFMVVCFFYTVIVSSKQKYYFPLLAFLHCCYP